MIKVPIKIKATININKLDKRSNIMCLECPYRKSKSPNTTYLENDLSPKSLTRIKLVNTLVVSDK